MIRAIQRLWQVLEQATTILSLVVLVFIGWRLVAGQGAPSTREASGGPRMETIAGLTTSNNTTRLPRNAKVVVVEFSDYECPYCRRYARDVYPLIEQNYIASAKIGYVMRAFPLERAHPHALSAAQAAECAGNQGRYWEMRDRLFDRRLDATSITESAGVLALDMQQFSKCLDGTTLSKIRADQAEAHRLNISGTPTFLIGIRADDDRIVLHQRISGIMSYDVFRSVLDKALAGS
jgi:protein-disulfide isomerase